MSGELSLRMGSRFITFGIGTAADESIHWIELVLVMMIMGWREGEKLFKGTSEHESTRENHNFPNITIKIKINLPLS